MEGGERQKGKDVKERCKKKRGQGWHKPRATEGRGDSLLAWRGLAWHGMAWHGRAVLGGHSNTCLGLFSPSSAARCSGWRFLGAQLGCCEVPRGECLHGNRAK